VQKFHFRFATVQKVRRIERDQQSRVLGSAMQELQVIRNQIEQLGQQNEMELLRVKLETQKGNFFAANSQLSAKFREEIRNQIRRKKKEEEAAMYKVEQERLKLVEKEKRKKVLDKLEERDREKYQEDLRKFQNQEMDELSSVREFARTFGDNS